MSNNLNNINYGDLIALKLRDNEQIMAIGQSDTRLQLQIREENKPCINYSDFVFRILPKLNQEVRYELLKKKKNFNKVTEDYHALLNKTVSPELVLKKYGAMNESDIQDIIQELRDELDLYEVRVKVEEQLNTSQLAQKRNNPVKQGDLVQLQHVNSEMQVLAKRNLAADVDKSAVLVQLSPSGSFQSIWKVLPSVNHLSQGDILKNSDGIFLVNEQNHCNLYSSGVQDKRSYPNVDCVSIKDPSVDRVFWQHAQISLSEVNCSQNSKEWTIELQRRGIEDEDQQLKCGDAIRIKNTSVDGQVCADIFENSHQKLSTDNTNLAYLRHYKGADQQEQMDSGTIFVLEKGSPVAENQGENGSIVKYTFLRENNFKYRIRHLNTWRYLKIAEIPIQSKRKSSDKSFDRVLALSSRFDIVTAKEHSNDNKEFDDATIFQFFSTSKENHRDVLVNSQVKLKFFKMKHAGSMVGNKIWLGSGTQETIINPLRKSSVLTDSEFYSMIEEDRSSIEQQALSLYDTDKDENSFLIEKVDPDYLRLLKHMHSCISVVHFFVEQLKTGSEVIISNWNEDYKTVLALVKNIRALLNGEVGLLQGSIDFTRGTMQKLARDLRLIDLVIDLVWRPFVVFGDKVTQENVSERQTLFEIQRTSQGIIRDVFENQRQNEFQAAQWIRLFISQSLNCDERNNIQADYTLANLIRSNKELLDHQINDTIISNLVDPQNKSKNVNLLSNMCVCKGEAVKSKQNRIIEQFLKRPTTVFVQFFVKMIDISVRGKENPVIECKGQIMKAHEVEQLIRSVHLVSCLCFDRNHKAIEVFENVYPFSNIQKAFLEREQIRLDLKSKFLELVVHLIFNREPWTYVAQPVKLQNQPPQQPKPPENVHNDEIKVVKKLVSNFLNMSSKEEHQDQLLNSVLKMVFFMTSHGIYPPLEQTIIMKTLVDRTHDLIFLKDNEDELDEHNTGEDGDNQRWVWEIQGLFSHFVSNLSTLLLDDGFDMALLSQDNSQKDKGNQERNRLAKIQGNITNQHNSLVLLIEIFSYLMYAKFQSAIDKFLTKINTLFLDDGRQQPLHTQVLVQCGFMPTVFNSCIRRRYMTMGLEKDQFFAENQVDQLGDLNLPHTFLSSFNKQVIVDLNDPFNTFCMDSEASFRESDHFLNSHKDIDVNAQAKFLQPIKWVSELSEEIETFGSHTTLSQKMKILEMISSFLASENSELQLKAYYQLMDSLFAMDEFQQRLLNIQLIDNEDLKELHFKFKIIAMNLKLQIELAMEDPDADTMECRLVAAAKLFIYLCNWCIYDQTNQDSTSNLDILERYGSLDVDRVFEELQNEKSSSSQSFFQLQEDMGAKLRAAVVAKDIKEFNLARKWAQQTVPMKFKCNSEIQLMMLNLKMHEYAFEQVKLDLSNKEGKTKQLFVILKNIAFRFLQVMSFNNETIIDIFEKSKRIIEQDLDTSLIAGQLWMEVIRHDKHLMTEKDNVISITRIAQLVSSQSENKEVEKTVGLRILSKFVCYRDEAVQFNQNMIVDILFKSPGINLVPAALRNKNIGNLTQQQPQADTNEDEEANYQMSKLIEEINMQVNTGLEKYGSCHVSPNILQLLEYLRILSSVTEFDNFYTESVVKDIYNIHKLMDIVDQAGDFVLLARRALQLLVNAFIDLEELEDNQILDLAELSPIMKTVAQLINKSVQFLNLKQQPKRIQQTDMNPMGVQTYQTKHDAAMSFIQEQAIYFVILLISTFKQRITESNDMKKVVEQLSDAPVPSKNKLQMLNQVVFVLQVKSYCPVVKDRLINFYESNKFILDNLEKQLEFVKPQTFLTKNKLLWKESKQISTGHGANTDTFIKHLLSFVSENVVWQFKATEQLRNFCQFLNENDMLPGGAKKSFLAKFIPVLATHHSRMPISQLTRGLRFLRMMVECINTRNFAAAVYWQTQDFLGISAHLEEVQNLLGDSGAVELTVILISTQSDNSLVNEALLLAGSLLCGGNLHVQNLFLKSQNNKGCDEIFLKLYDFLNIGFNKIQSQYGSKSNLTITEKQGAMIEDCNFIIDGQLDKTNDSECKKFQIGYFESKQLNEGKCLHEMDPTQIQVSEQVSSMSEDITDYQEQIFRILKFLQNLCENHNKELQEFLREQTQSSGEVSSKSKNFVQLLCNIQKRFLNINCKELIWLGIQIVDTLVEFIQGPCQQNQVQIVKDKGLDTARDVLFGLKTRQELNQAGFTSDQDSTYVSLLKFKTIVLINSLCEGNTNESEIGIQEEIPKSVEIEILVSRLIESFCSFCLKYYISEDLNLYGSDPDERNTKVLEYLDNNNIEIEVLKDNSKDQFLQEGFNIKLLLLTICDQNKDFKSRYQQVLKNLTNKRPVNFYKMNICNVDVNVFNSIWRIQFPLHPQCRFLSYQTKKKFSENVERDSPASKLNGLLNESKFLTHEMHLQYSFNQMKFQPQQWVVSLLKDLLFALAFVQNAIFLSLPVRRQCVLVEDCQNFMAKQGYDLTELSCVKNNQRAVALGWCHVNATNRAYFLSIHKQSAVLVNWLSNILGFMQLLFSVVIFIVWLLNNLDLLKQRYWQNFTEEQKYNCDKQLKIEGLDDDILNSFLERKNDDLTDQKGEKLVLYLKGPDAPEFRGVEGAPALTSGWLMITQFWHETWAVLQNSFFEQQLTQVMMSALGITVNQLFFIFHIQDIVQRFPELMNILYAITKNCEMLTLTLILSVILTQIQTLIGFRFFFEAWMLSGSQNFQGRPTDQMSDVLTGLMYNVNVGIRSGGTHINTVSIQDPEYFARLGYDLMFIVLVVVILMNILFGIVIDTFGELYETNQELQNDMNNICFICEMQRDTLEKQGVSFDQHVAYDHNWENQLYQIMHLAMKDKAFQNGVEFEISGMIAKSDVNFFPRHKVFDLNLETDEEGEGEALNTSKLYAATSRIKSDMKKINELLDEKLKSQSDN